MYSIYCTTSSVTVFIIVQFLIFLFFVLLCTVALREHPQILLYNLYNDNKDYSILSVVKCFGQHLCIIIPWTTMLSNINVIVINVTITTNLLLLATQLCYVYQVTFC